MRGTRRLESWCLILAIVAVCCAPRVRADAIVYVRSSGFSPASVLINVGEAVYFIVADDNAPYCIQSTTGAWTPWYLWEYGDGFGLQFNQRGDYYYQDIFTYNTGVIHVGTSMTNIPPSVSITSPDSGSVFTEPASFTFSADAADPDNGILGVEFYVGTELVDVVYDGVYSTQVTNLAAGSYTLTAVAHDTLSAAATNSVSITVQPPAAPVIRLLPPRMVAGQFQFDAIGLTVGKQAVLQSAPSLGSTADWASIQTNAVTSSSLSFTHPAGIGTKFFRVLQLP